MNKLSSTGRVFNPARDHIFYTPSSHLRNNENKLRYRYRRRERLRIEVKNFLRRVAPLLLFIKFRENSPAESCVIGEPVKKALVIHFAHISHPPLLILQ